MVNSRNVHFFGLKVKVKFPRHRPGMAQGVGRGIALLFHDRGTRRGWVVNSTPRPHFTPGKDPVPILQGPQGRSGGAENVVPSGIRSRIFQLVVSIFLFYIVYMNNDGTCLKIVSVKPEGCFIDCSKVWRPLVYPNREDLNPCCDFRSYKITARYVFHETAPSWRGHLWITHLAFHPSCAVQPHKVHWRTEEEKLQALLHLLIT